MPRDVNRDKDWPDAYSSSQDPEPRRLHPAPNPRMHPNFGADLPDTPRWFKVWVAVIVVIMLGIVSVGGWAIVEVVQWVTKK